MSARSWQLNNVALDISPGPLMTLMITGEVLEALEDIVQRDHWTFATLVQVMDSYQGRLGQFNIRYYSTNQTRISSASIDDH